uniref:SGNH hydrolase-type esterase domain-containing protein n=1 Tax=Stegastes partitus TaxID=144197 RepID=A0A3B5B1B8_9TELE
MPPLTSPSRCTSCLHLSQKISELEWRISTLYQIRDEERSMDSLVTVGPAVGTAAPAELDSTVPCPDSTAPAAVHWAALGAKPKARACSTPGQEEPWILALKVTQTGRSSRSPRSPDVAGSPHLPPRPLFRPTTLIVGNSIIRNVHFFNATTRCFLGASVSIPPSVCHVVIHVGMNDTARRQSERTKKDFMDLFALLESCGKSVFISGPISTLPHSAERFSRLLSLNTWLHHTCAAHHLLFIDNFNLFWNRPQFYRPDGLDPSRWAARQELPISQNSSQIIKTIPGSSSPLLIF